MDRLSAHDAAELLTPALGICVALGVLIVGSLIAFRKRSGFRPALAFLSLAFVLGAGASGWLWKKSQDLGPVVRTWAELARLEPFELPFENSARVGIEATRFPLGSGVLIYCLADKFRWTPGANLGPLRVVVDHEQAQVKRLEGVDSRLRLPNQCYARTLTFPHAGNFDVRLLDESGTEVQTIAVEVTNEPFHGWTPWSYPTRLQQLSSARSPYFLRIVAMDEAFAAVPRFRGKEPLTKPGENFETIRNRPMPKLFPTEPTAGVEFKQVRPGRLLLKTPFDIDITMPRLNFLTRWWVNGQPFRPQSIATLQKAISFSGRALLGAAIEFDVDFDPSAIGAKPGDTIEVQLLYVPDGWTTPENYGELARLQHERNGTIMTPRLQFQPAPPRPQVPTQ
ncbi:MAG: hypothetical protein AAF517_07075 [Planctomycetota bacterium]